MLDKIKNRLSNITGSGKRKSPDRAPDPYGGGAAYTQSSSAPYDSCHDTRPHSYSENTTQPETPINPGKHEFHDRRPPSGSTTTQMSPATVTSGKHGSHDKGPNSYGSTTTQTSSISSTSVKRKSYDREQDSYRPTPTYPPTSYVHPDSRSSGYTTPVDSSQFRTGNRGPQTSGGIIPPSRTHQPNKAAEFLSNFTQKLQKRITSPDPSGVEQPPSAGYHTLPSEESPILHPKATNDTPNVIIFGETGVGKSSLINMVAATTSAAVSNAAIGCTFESVPYDAELSDRKYRLWDTAGLNEGEHGNVSADRAIESLQELVQSLTDGGVSLLVYCIRGSRLRDIVKINYDLFHKIICSGKVPIVVVITGLENEDDMEDWWMDNAEDFDRRGMKFAGHACITTTKGKVMKNGDHMFQEEYNQSVELVRDLVAAHCAERAWKPDSSRWLGNIVENMREMYAESGNRAQDYAPGIDSPAVAERSRVKPAPYARTDYPQNTSRVQEYASSVNSTAIVDGSRGAGELESYSHRDYA